MRYEVRRERAADETGGAYATYSLRWAGAAVHDVSTEEAFVRRVADALNRGAVPPCQVMDVLEDFYGEREYGLAKRRWWE